MKKVLFILLLSSSFFAQGQSLKEALYSGKLKNEPGKVIRKGDDLSTQIDTTRTNVNTNAETTMSTDATTDSSTIDETTTIENAAISTPDASGNSTDSATSAVSETTPEPTEKATAPKDNNAIWKDYMNMLAGNLKTDALPSKKVKRGSYYVLVSYSIDTTGLVTISDVFVSPENAYLQQQIKDRISLEAPTLAPVLNSSGTPRKVNKKSNFTLIKE